MMDFFFIVFFFLVPILSFKIIKLSRINIFRVSVPSLFILNYLVVSYIGILFFYFGWDSPALLRGVNNKELILKMFYLSAASMVLFAAGFSFITITSKSLKRKYYEIGLPKPLKKISLLIVAFIFAFSTLILYFYIKYLPDVPLLHVLMGDPRGAIYARTTLLTTNVVLIGKASYYNTFIRMVMPFLCYILFAEALISKRRSVKLMFAMSFVITAFGNMLDTAKGPLIGLFIGLFLTYLSIRNQRFSLKNIILISVVIVVFSIPMYTFFMGSGGNVWDKAEHLARRIFTGNLVPSYYVVQLFEHKNYLLGRSFPNPRGILPFEQYLLYQEIWIKLMNPLDVDVLYSAPAGFWAEMYANFGAYGVFTAPFVGIFLYIIQLLLNKLPHSSVKSALIVWCAMHFMGIPGKGIFSFFWDYYLVAVLLVAFFIFFIEGNGKIKLQRSALV